MVRIVELRKLGGYLVFLRFSDGAQGDVDVSQVVPFRGVFQRLTDPAEFDRVTLDPDWGTIRWGDDLDIAPESLRDRLA